MCSHLEHAWSLARALFEQNAVAAVLYSDGMTTPRTRSSRRHSCTIASVLAALGGLACAIEDETPVEADPRDDEATADDSDAEPPGDAPAHPGTDEITTGAAPMAADTSDLDIALTGDLDGDGEDEAIVWRTQAGTWFAKRRNGTRVFPAGSEPVWGLPDDKPLVGDLDGDGADEMIVWRPSTGRWYALRDDGTRIFAAGTEPSWGMAGDAPFVGDLDGDGADDMVVWRPSNHRWYGLRRNGTRIFPMGSEPTWTTGEHQRMLGDLDGDGADEMVGWRPSTGGWYALRSDGTRVFPAGSEPSWGVAGDVPMLGDLDNAGGDELVVWRPSTGRWYGLRPISLTRIWPAGSEPTFGAAGDHPHVAEVSAGAEDLVIHRPATARWWARTTGGTALMTNVAWGSASAPARIVGFESDDDLGDASRPGGDVYFARTAAPTAGAADGWWVRLDALVENTGTAPITVTGFTVDTNSSAADDVALDTPVIIPGGESRAILIPGGWADDNADPTVLTVEANIDGFAQPIARDADLVEYESGTASGGVAFPGSGVDLGPGEYWSIAATHSHTPTQRYAYDFENFRFDSATDTWTSRLPNTNGAFNWHYLIWQRPLYAVADATIVRCSRSEADHEPGGEGESGGGNTVILELEDGTFLAYYHMRQNSMPAALCPFEGPDGDDWTPLSIPVQEGDFLGLVGSSGHSARPHVHMQVLDTANNDDPDARGLPLRFHGVDVQARYNADTTNPVWNSLSTSESAVLDDVLIAP